MSNEGQRYQDWASALEVTLSHPQWRQLIVASPPQLFPKADTLLEADNYQFVC